MKLTGAVPTEDAAVQSDRSLDTDLIALYKALGGGWQPPEAKLAAAADSKQIRN